MNKLSKKLSYGEHYVFGLSRSWILLTMGDVLKLSSDSVLVGEELGWTMWHFVEGSTSAGEIIFLSQKYGIENPYLVLSIIFDRLGKESLANLNKKGHIHFPWNMLYEVAASLSEIRHKNLDKSIEELNLSILKTGDIKSLKHKKEFKKFKKAIKLQP